MKEILIQPRTESKKKKEFPINSFSLKWTHVFVPCNAITTVTTRTPIFSRILITIQRVFRFSKSHYFFFFLTTDFNGDILCIQRVEQKYQ